MVGLDKKLVGGVFHGSSMTMKSALIIISSMLIRISIVMQVSSSALAAESKDVGVSSFNKGWKRNVVEEDYAAATDGGKRVLVSDRRHLLSINLLFLNV
jgi:hypothetical protein